MDGIIIKVISKKLNDGKLYNKKFKVLSIDSQY